MRFMNPTNGEIYSCVHKAVYQLCCRPRSACDTPTLCVMQTPESRRAGGCVEYSDRNPADTARLLGLIVIEGEEGTL